MAGVNAGVTWEGAGMMRPRGMTRPGGNGGESNLLRPGRNPCRKRKRNRLGRRIDLKAKMAYNDATRVM